MSESGLKRWNDRYSQKEYAYGTEPNVFLKEQLEKLPVGKILFAAEGEGRNAVYASKLGWTVSAFDISSEGRKKALQLAETNNVEIDYRVGQLPDLKFQDDEFDAVVLIYAHLPPQIRPEYHRLLNTYLRKGGIVIIEVFSKSHLEYQQKDPAVGGPKDIDTLFSMEEITTDFKNYEIILLEEKEVELQEGLYHNGKGSVIRFVGRKK